MCGDVTYKALNAFVLLAVLTLLLLVFVRKHRWSQNKRQRPSATAAHTTKAPTPFHRFSVGPALAISGGRFGLTLRSRQCVEQVAFGSNRDRHCEQSEAIQGNVGRPRSLGCFLWIASSLRSSQ
jgi:hypothetical protein